MRRIADFFRETFATAFGQYVFAEADLRPLPVEAFFDHPHPTLAELDALPLPPGHRFWHEPAATLANMRAKLQGRGHAALIEIDGRLRGMSFGYPCTLRQAFTWEEWENPAAYSGFVPAALRSFDAFRDRLQEHIPWPLDADSPAYVWNCIALAPELRGKGLGEELARRQAEVMRPTGETVMLLEVLPGSAWHKTMRRHGAAEMADVLAEGHLLLAMDLADFVGRIS